MAQTSVSPVVLIILDGWGYREAKDGNAIAAAKKPVMDSLWEVYPRTLIRTKAVNRKGEATSFTLFAVCGMRPLVRHPRNAG